MNVAVGSLMSRGPQRWKQVDDPGDKVVQVGRDDKAEPPNIHVQP